MFGGLGVGEVLLIFAVLLLVFGAKRLPEIGGAMGKGIRDFKRSINGVDDEPRPRVQPRAEERRVESGSETRTQSQSVDPAETPDPEPARAEGESPPPPR
ncbi:MAG: twin-arginine translocase TatA/TatE family subunit [Longimicrobiaceae bacterium]